MPRPVFNRSGKYLPKETRQSDEYYRLLGWDRKQRGVRVIQWKLISQFNPEGYESHWVYKPSQQDLFLEPALYRVYSQWGPKRQNGIYYLVRWKGSVKKSECTCVDWGWNQLCKHVRGVAYFRKKGVDSGLQAPGEDNYSLMIDFTPEEVIAELKDQEEGAIQAQTNGVSNEDPWNVNIPVSDLEDEAKMMQLFADLLDTD